MTGISRFVRGAVGTMVTWSVGWGVAGTAITALSATLTAWLTNETPLAVTQIGESGMFYAMLGAWSGAAFAALMALVERRTSWERLREDRFVLLGAAAGAAYPAVAVILTRASLQLPMRGLGETFAVCVGLGVLSAAATLRLARSNRARALSEAEAPAVDPSLLNEALQEVERMLAAPTRHAPLGADSVVDAGGARQERSGT